MIEIFRIVGQEMSCSINIFFEEVHKSFKKTVIDACIY